MKLSGKKALVTGAAGGIGKAIVNRLQAEGAVVAGSDFNLTGTKAEASLPGDLTDKSYTDGLPAAARDALGGLDIVINNAGIITRGAITDSTDEDFTRSMAVNVEAPFRICKAAIPILEANLQRQ